MVADSVPTAEYQEVLAKSAIVRRALKDRTRFASSADGRTWQLRPVRRDEPERQPRKRRLVTEQP